MTGIISRVINNDFFASEALRTDESIHLRLGVQNRKRDHRTDRRERKCEEKPNAIEL